MTVPSPAHTRVRGFDFRLPISGREGPYETGLISSSRAKAIYLLNNDLITAT